MVNETRDGYRFNKTLSLSPCNETTWKITNGELVYITKVESVNFNV